MQRGCTREQMEDAASAAAEAKAKEAALDYWPLLTRVHPSAQVTVTYDVSGALHTLLVDVKRRSKWVEDGCKLLLWDGDDAEDAESNATDFFEVEATWVDDVPGMLCVSTRQPKERLQRCADAFRGDDYTPSFFFGKAYEGGALAAYSNSSLLEYMTSLEDNARRRSETFDDMLACITYEDEASALTRASSVEQFEAEAGLSSKFLVTFGRLCRGRNIFGTDTPAQRDRALRFDQILACHSARWELLKSLRVLEQCQAEDYDPSVTNGLGFQTAMFPGDGKKEGVAEMYERLLAHTYKNNLRRSGNMVYQQQKTKMEFWKAHASTCGAAGHLLHRYLPGCKGEFVYGVKPGDAWCLGYAEYYCEQLAAASVSEQGRVEGFRLRINAHLNTCRAPDDPRWEAARLWTLLWSEFERTIASHVAAKDAGVPDPTETIAAMVAKSCSGSSHAFAAYTACSAERPMPSQPLTESRFCYVVRRYLSTLCQYVCGLEEAYKNSEEEKAACEARGNAGKSQHIQFEKMRQLVAIVAKDVSHVSEEVKVLRDLVEFDVDGDAGACSVVWEDAAALLGEADDSDSPGTLTDGVRALLHLSEWKVIMAELSRGSCSAAFFSAADTLTSIFQELTFQMLKHGCAWWLRPQDSVTWLDSKGTRVVPAEDMFTWKRAVAAVCTNAKHIKDASAIRNMVCVTMSDVETSASCRLPVWREDRSQGDRVAVSLGCRTWTQKMNRLEPMKVVEIGDMVMEFMDQNRMENSDRWRAFVERFQANLSNAEAYMSKTVDDAFPVHVPDTGLFSFLNGMYSIRDNQFYMYDNVPSSWKSGLNYIPQYFDPLLVHMPIDCIRVPGYDDILASQHYGAEEAGGSKRYWLDVFIGRVFFPIGAHDDWQKVLIIKGQGATGKSSIAKAIMKCVGEKNVGIIASNCEPQYALANMQNKTMWACTEMKANFRLDMAAMQNMISGDPVTINAKYKDAVDIGSWQLPGLLIGNEIPKAWMCDVGGALLRRAVLFEFGVNPAKQDSNVVHNFAANLPAFLVRTTRTYLQATKANKGVLVLPLGMQYFQSTFAKITSPFAQFLADPLVTDFEYGDEDRLWGIYSQLFKSAVAVKTVVKAPGLGGGAGAGAGVGAGSSSGGDDTGALSGIDLGMCYEMKDGVTVEECGLTRETLQQVCEWIGKHDKDSDALQQPEAGEPDGHVSVPQVVTRYRAWKSDKKQAGNIPDLDKGTIEAMCKQLGILYKNDKLYGLKKKE